MARGDKANETRKRSSMKRKHNMSMLVMIMTSGRLCGVVGEGGYARRYWIHWCCHASKEMAKRNKIIGKNDQTPPKEVKGGWDGGAANKRYKTGKGVGGRGPIKVIIDKFRFPLAAMGGPMPLEWIASELHVRNTKNVEYETTE